jgi:hypothetical protein
MPTSQRRLARTTTELTELSTLRTRYGVALQELRAEGS